MEEPATNNLTNDGPKDNPKDQVVENVLANLGKAKVEDTAEGPKAEDPIEKFIAEQKAN